LYYGKTCNEPPLAEVLTDPIIRLIMGYDQVKEEDIDYLVGQLCEEEEM
jgi:hypothetical protein